MGFWGTNETLVAPLFALTVPLRRALQPVILVAGFTIGVGAVTGAAMVLNSPVGVVNVPLSLAAVARK